MPVKDPYLGRINRALKELGYAVALEVVPSGQRLRLRGTLPCPDGSWKRQRISTALPYPLGIDQARKLAEKLGHDLQLFRMGLQAFPFEQWFGDSTPAVEGSNSSVSGTAALRSTENWWRKQRKRGGSADVSWKTDYAAPLKPLLDQPAVDLRVLTALVESKEVGSRSRRRASIAAVAVARAIELGPEAVQGLKDLGKGYSPQKDAAPRDLPSDALILEVIDALPSDWQWVAGICATYGTRPHEALLMADVESNGLVVIRGGKTGARQGLPLPKEWIARWALQTKRLGRVPLRGVKLEARMP
jgi:hypothetical protein